MCRNLLPKVVSIYKISLRAGHRLVISLSYTKKLYSTPGASLQNNECMYIHKTSHDWPKVLLRFLNSLADNWVLECNVNLKCCQKLKIQMYLLTWSVCPQQPSSPAVPASSTNLTVLPVSYPPFSAPNIPVPSRILSSFVSNSFSLHSPSTPGL